MPRRRVVRWGDNENFIAAAVVFFIFGPLLFVSIRGYRAARQPRIVSLRRKAGEIGALEVRGVDRPELVVRDEARCLAVDPPQQHFVEGCPAIRRERLEPFPPPVRLQLELALSRARLGLGPGGAR